MISTMTETHAHLDMPDFDTDRNEVLARAAAAGVSKIVTIGIDLKSSQKAIELADSHPQIYASVGIHPHEADRVSESNIPVLGKLAGKPKVVAIEEIGLDYYRNRSAPENQRRVLKWQLALARKMRLPAIIHWRRRDNDYRTATSHEPVSLFILTHLSFLRLDTLGRKGQI